MNETPTPRRRSAAFTLIEMMVAGTVLAIVTSFFLSSLSIQKQTYSVNDQVVEIQHGARIIGDVLERDLRHAGFMTPPGAGLCIIDNTNSPDTLFVSDDAAVDPTQENESDLAAQVQVGVNNVITGIQTLVVDDLILEIVNPSPMYDTDANGAADADFRIGGGAIVVDAANPDRGTACATVVAVPSPTTIQLNVLSPPLSAAMVNPAQLVVVPARAYVVDAQNRLVRDGIIVANDVEDFQLAMFIDDNQDGTIDPGEYRGDGVGPNIASNLLDHSLAREVRANIVLRTRDQDPDFTQGLFQATENRAPVAGADGFRRRVWSSTTMLRNVRPRAV